MQLESHVIRKRMQLASRRLTASFVCVVLSCVALTGCIVAPVPMRKHIEASGKAPDQKALDLSFMHSGQTKRDEVVQKLSLIDAGSTKEDLFLGRWVSSGSGWVWLMASQYSADGGYWRNWKVHNLVINFNQDGILTGFRQVDDAHLVKAFTRLPAAVPSVDSPITAAVEFKCCKPQRDIELLLQPDSVAFHELDWLDGDFSVTPNEIARLHLRGVHHPDPAHLHMRLTFRQKTKMGRSLNLAIAPSELLRLTSYLQTVNPAAVQ